MTYETFQNRVQPWMMECFGAEISSDKMERNHRFLEEALELVQASGCTKEEAGQLVEYVYGRDEGEINQEVGGVMVTLAAHCLAHGIDMHVAGETELARVWTKVEKIRAKQASKPKHSPLPQSVDTPAPSPAETALRAENAALKAQLATAREEATRNAEKGRHIRRIGAGPKRENYARGLVEASKDILAALDTPPAQPAPLVAETDLRAQVAALREALLRAAEIARKAIPNIAPDGPSSPEHEAVYVEMGHVYTAIRALIDTPQPADDPVAWRVRVKSNDPEEWSLLPAGGGADYLEREGYECQPLYKSAQPAALPVTVAKAALMTPEVIRAAQKAADDAYYRWRGLGERKDGQGLDGMTYIVKAALSAALAALPPVQP